jgi:hypothetical protein
MILLVLTLLAMICLFIIFRLVTKTQIEHFYPSFPIPPIILTDTIAVIPSPPFPPPQVSGADDKYAAGRYDDNVEDNTDKGGIDTSVPATKYSGASSSNAGGATDGSSSATSNTADVSGAADASDTADTSGAADASDTADASGAADTSGAAADANTGTTTGATGTESDTHASHAAAPTDGSAFPIHDETSSLHQSFTDGEMITAAKLDPIIQKLSLPKPQQMIEKIDSANAFNPGQPPEKKLAAAYLVLATLGKLKTLPAELFVKDCPNWDSGSGDDRSCDKAGKAYGMMKYHSILKDYSTVSSILKQHGGNQYTLSNEELMTLWSTNEHHNLHCCLIPGGHVGNAIHMTSLNNRAHVFTDMCKDVSKCNHPEVKNPKVDVICAWPDFRKDRAGGDGSLCSKGWYGGYNDTGRHHQWGWFQNVMNLKGVLGMQ